MLLPFLILLLAFQVKHLIADYYLQYPYMYENKGKLEGWLHPLLDHTLIHILGTIAITTAYGICCRIDDNTATVFTILMTVTLFDGITHFITDRWKATQKTDPSQQWFWRSLGIDQMIHHTAGILIAYYLVTV